ALPHTRYLGLSFVNLAENPSVESSTRPYILSFPFVLPKYRPSSKGGTWLALILYDSEIKHGSRRVRDSVGSHRARAPVGYRRQELSKCPKRGLQARENPIQNPPGQVYRQFSTEIPGR